MAFLGATPDNFFDPTELRGVIKNINLRGNSHPLKAILPLLEEDTHKVEMDVAHTDIGGMTQASVEQAESPIVPKTVGGARVSFEAQEFREKFIWNGSDYSNMRRLGTREERMSAAAYMTKALAQLKMRHENRMEFMRSQALYDNQVVFTPAGTTNSQTITYLHPDDLRPSASNDWDASNATPLSDLNAWANLLADTGISSNYKVFLTRKTLSLLTRSDEVKNVFQTAYQNRGGIGPLDQASSIFMPSEAMKEIVRHFVGDIEFIINSDMIRYSTTLRADAAGAQDEIVVASTEGFSAGRRVILSGDRIVKQFRTTVEAVNHTTRVVTLSDDLPHAFTSGMQVHCLVPFSPDDKIILAATPDMGMSFEDNAFNGFDDADGGLLPSATIGNVVSTRNTYHLDERLQGPGYFTKYNEHNEADPPHAEVIAGIKALPRIVYPEYYVVGTVLS